MRNVLVMAALSLMVATSGVAHAAGDRVHAPKQSWSFQGVFGTFDRGAVKRGSQVFFEVCNACHSLDMVSYRNLVEIGMDEDAVKALAASYEVQDGPNGDGDMFMRPARLSDRIVAPFVNENTARFFNGGAYPPDLSVITKARVGGPDYIYGLMAGYKDTPPEGFELSEGTSYNEYFVGHQIFMSRPLDDGSVEYDDGTEATLEQHARDVVEFLAWSAEPELEERKSLGVWVMGYLIVLTTMFYFLKIRIWKRICLDDSDVEAHEDDDEPQASA